ncbi:protein phosphatase 2C domain-containing protein [Streptomyces sp. NPDC059564]|uniref:protein phosphatase 2C domain-containing protein n=1 Tax=Streptomyces sp. NPDC059564 TaxID=3346865 RepID=UPI003680F4AC
MSMHRLSGCPNCAEPLEEGDRFCGVCGYALSSPPPPPDPDPTLPVGSLTPPSKASAAPRTPTASTTTHPGQGPGVPPSGEPGAYSPTSTDPTPSGPAPGGAPVTGAGAYSPANPAPAGSAPGGHPGQEGAAPAAYPAAPAHAPAPAGSAPYGVPAPGWESAAEHAPTLAGDASGLPGPGAPWGSADSGHEAPYGQEPLRHDLPGGSGTPQGPPPPGEPYGDTPQAPPAPEDPYASQGDGGKTCVACRAGHVDTDGYCEHCGHAQPRERDHLEEELGSVAAVSDRGLRHHRNEDSFAVAATALPDGSAATVAIVCDGVSSASRPDEASEAAAGAANEALLDALPRGAHPTEAMHEAILAAAAAVSALAPETPGAQNAPACTLVGAVVSGGVLTIGWVGDSRAYWVPDDRAALPRRLTEDDSWAAQMVAAGLMGEAEAYADVRAHAITGWLGADAYDLDPHTASFRPDHPGVVVVCTDGLWNYAESALEMARILPADAAVRPLHSAQVLVGHALDGGGHDNVTVAVVPFSAEPDAAREQERAQEHEAEAESAPRAETEPHTEV